MNASFFSGTIKHQDCGSTGTMRLVSSVYNILLRNIGIRFNKPRTAKVGAISKAQKVRNFQNMLMTFFYGKLTKKFHPKEAFRAGKTLQKFGYSGWAKCEHLFSNLRLLLLSETEYASEITSRIRILRFTPDITFKFRIVLKKILVDMY